MVSDKFRRQLRQEMQRWQSDGLIDARQYQQLANRYQFSALEDAARDRFVLILIGLGSVLLGLGVITFVAANWQAIPRELRVLLLLSLFVGVSASGFYLWRRPVGEDGRQGWQQRVGQGLLLLGGLILGANMALMGQLFHQSGSPYALCLLWGLGVLVMAYGLRLTSLGVLSAILLGIGYWLGIQEAGYPGIDPVFSAWMQHMPLIAAALLIPLAYWCRSRVIFGLGAIAVVSSLITVLIDLNRFFSDAPGIIVAAALALPPALLWSYNDDAWWRLIHRPSPTLTASFRPIAQFLAVLYMAASTYWFSFHWAWTERGELLAVPAQITRLFSDGLPVLLNPSLLGLTIITVILWVQRFQPQRPGGRWGLHQSDSIFLCFLATVALVSYWHWGAYPIQTMATYAFNVLLFLLGCGLIREAIARGQRFKFWSGMILLALQILSRTLEYDTGLLFKSLAFILCGVGVILIGLWFERYVRSLALPQTAELEL